MQQASEKNCFFSKQLNHFNTHNPNPVLGKHLLECSICSNQIENLQSNDNKLKMYFDSFKITSSIEQQLKSELTETFKNIGKSTVSDIDSNLKDALKDNFLAFIGNLLQPTQLILMLSAVVSFVSFYLLFRPI